MKILMPIQNKDEIVPLLEAGASEFYCGYISERWKRRYNKEKADGILQISLNNRDREKTNFETQQELKEALNLCERYNKTIYLTMNAKWYPESCYGELDEYIQEVSQIGIKHLIVSDIGFIQFLSDCYPEMKLSISCLNEIYNSASVEFYRQFHPERIVFPRHIDIRDVELIAKECTDMEFEVFVLSDKCIYNDGNCRCLHDWMPICQENWSTNYQSESSYGTMTREFLNQIEKCSDLFFRWSNDYKLGYEDVYKWAHVGCSLCAIHNLMKLSNVVSYKVVGRGYKLSEKIFQAQLVFKIMEMIRAGLSILEIMNYMAHISGEATFCSSGMHCIMRGKYDGDRA